MKGVFATLSIITFSKMTLSMKGLLATLSIMKSSKMTLSINRLLLPAKLSADI